MIAYARYIDRQRRVNNLQLARQNRVMHWLGSAWTKSSLNVVFTHWLGALLGARTDCATDNGDVVVDLRQQNPQPTGLQHSLRCP